MTGVLAQPLATVLGVPPSHAVPLAACDRIGYRTEGGVLRVTAITDIPGDGPYLADHFPELTIFPGVFILEAVAQAVAQAVAAAAAPAVAPAAGRSLRVRAVRSLRMLVPLYPGDQLRLSAEATDPGSEDRLVVTADCRRGDGVRAATLTIECGRS